MESSLCFFGLLLVVFLYHHLAGLLVFSWLTFVLVKANDALRRQAALKERRKGKQLLGLALGLLLHVPLTLWLLKGQQLWLVFGCLPPPAIETVRCWWAIWVWVVGGVGGVRWLSVLVVCTTALLVDSAPPTLLWGLPTTTLSQCTAHQTHKPPPITGVGRILYGGSGRPPHPLLRHGAQGCTAADATHTQRRADTRQGPGVDGGGARVTAV